MSALSFCEDSADLDSITEWNHFARCLVPFGAMDQHRFEQDGDRRSADSVAIPGGVQIFQDRQTLRSRSNPARAVARLVPRLCAVRSASPAATPGTATRRPGGPLDSAIGAASLTSGWDTKCEVLNTTRPPGKKASGLTDWRNLVLRADRADGAWGDDGIKAATPADRRSERSAWAAPTVSTFMASDGDNIRRWRRSSVTETRTFASCSEGGSATKVAADRRTVSCP